jgi:peptidoglycan/LPS O-acetylase OafA/YrhL
MVPGGSLVEEFMPKPVRTGQRYLPGLDGLRALAVLAVVAYHLNLGWAQGGLLGVGVFFTLSGYLITDLLLNQYDRTGRLQMADFWLRRARRLLPALFVMLTVVVAWVTLLDRSQLPAIRGAVAASVGYVSNWWLIAQHSSYFARFSPPSPLGHLWSLAVEEQFYLIWPWLLWFGLRWFGRRGGTGARPRLAAATLLLAAASAVAMAMFYQPGYDPTRVYDGTDTRAFGLLIGAALAFVWPSCRLRSDVADGARRILDGTGIAGLAIIFVLIWRTSEYSAFLYHGGMVLLSVATALVVGAAASPASRVGVALGCRPLRWIGVRSYGIYLWHFPIIVLTTPADGQETLLRGTLQVAASIAVAAVSWRFIEEPVRHGAIGRGLAHAAAVGYQLGAARHPTRVALAGCVAVCGLATAGLTGIVQPASAAMAAGTPPPAGASTPSPSPSPSASPAAATPSPSPPKRAPARSKRPGTKQPAQAPSPLHGPARSSCRSVVHIGDSTSDGLISPDYLPNPKQRINAQYAKVGATTFIPEISGARSIVETYENQPNAFTVAQQLMRSGYRGCWVLALGTNDTADVAVGSHVGLATRIREMMTLIGDQPVMWVNVKSLLVSGPYAETNMAQWDSTLLQACAHYPNMRVYDWAAAAKNRWFISDGIHYTSLGYAWRAHLIPKALAAAFPQGAAQTGRGAGSRNCLVA